VSEKQRILVTGGAGFVGSFLVDRLVRDGHRVRIFDSLDPQVHPGGAPPAHLNAQAEFVRGDVRDLDAFRGAVAGMDVVYHLAAAVGVGQSQYAVKYYVDVNCGGTANLLEILANAKLPVRKVVVMASMSSYGEGLYSCAKCGGVRPDLRTEAQMATGAWEPVCPACGGAIAAVPTPESATQNCNSIYALTKKFQEDSVLNIGRTYGIPSVALRAFNIYGPRQSLSNPYTGVAAIFLSRLKCGERPYVYEDGLQTRDFVSVHDIVSVLDLVRTKSEADYRSFNVGNGKPIAVKEIASTLASLLGVDLPPLLAGKFRKGDVRHCYADVSELRDRLGYAPRVAFRDGMQELIAWSRGAKAEDRFGDAMQELSSKGLVT
jgi:dTDP-L-rhamnose 4-epimerase